MEIGHVVINLDLVENIYQHTVPVREWREVKSVTRSEELKLAVPILWQKTKNLKLVQAWLAGAGSQRVWS